MPDGHGYEVDPAELQKASREITDCVPMPKEVPLEEIPGNAQRYGHGAVFAALSRFCTTWQIATAVMSSSAQQAGGALQGAAVNYLRQEQAGDGVFSGLGAQLHGVVPGIGEAVLGVGSAISDRLDGGAGSAEGAS